MVKFVKKGITHEDFCSFFHNSEGYKNASSEQQERYDKILQSEEVKAFCKGHYVPQFSLGESMALAFLNKACQVRPDYDQTGIEKYVNSDSFQGSWNRLERFFNSLSEKFLRIRK